MRSAMRTAHRVRLAAVLALGAFALHQLRYLIAFGGSSSAELARQGHSYMADALPVLAVFALSALLATLIRSRFGPALSRAPLARRAATLALALLAIYVTQESLEGLLAAGHPGSVGVVLAAGGWLAFPLALVLGVLAALLIRALEGIEVALSASVGRTRLPRAPRISGSRRRAPGANLLDTPLAFGLARRPPPLLSA
jgi:hypothetical protein